MRSFNLEMGILSQVSRDQACLRNMRPAHTHSISIPAGTVALSLLLLTMPHDFPFMGQSRPKISLHSLRRVDFTGAIILLAASVLLISALEEGGTQYSWRSAVTLVLLFTSIFAWFAFFTREKIQSVKKAEFDSVLPWKLITNRFWASLILHAFFAGTAYLTVVIDLPQKFQVVNSDSAFRAGYHLLALMMSFSLASVITGILTEKKKVPPFYTLLVAASLQIIGVALMTSLSVTQHSFPAAEYGYEIIMGFGFGLSISTLIMCLPIIAEHEDRAVTMGAIAQFRTLGGTLGISICTNLLNNHLKSGLNDILTKAQVTSLLESAHNIITIPPEQRGLVENVYAEGYRSQVQALTAFSAAALLATFLMLERKPRRMP